MKTLYKIAYYAALRAGAKRLEAWAYMRWLRWWMRKDPVMGYWRFSAEYLGTGESRPRLGAQ